ncbi:MAG: hypothetical protein E6726_08330 [Clostridium sp.]|nr:hypothetical protein [Clostridium sp.]MDU1978400.1 hypothetical protein [Clostridium sp.]MDU1994802.1 hypothetical protein [Clostridium sp.]MDU6048461.1 hypothetical protein [Clostridium sp.]MDU6222517.1 hypothetical protein [Clostridium sp.]MDU6272585.1 hypothetical protein [Clostridium sp.]
MNNLKYNKYLLTLIIKKALDKDRFLPELEREIYAHIKINLKDRDTS